MAKKIVYYDDLNNDDFAVNKLDKKKVTSDFPFARKNPLWRALEFFLYRIFATPIVFLIGKVGFGLKIRNRKVLKKLRGTGFFIYGNHTHGMMDAYIPTLASLNS